MIRWSIFTSDNGCSPVAKYPGKLLAKGHDPEPRRYRGTKADIFEAEGITFVHRAMAGEKSNPGRSVIRSSV